MADADKAVINSLGDSLFVGKDCGFSLRGFMDEELLFGQIVKRTDTGFDVSMDCV